MADDSSEKTAGINLGFSELMTGGLQPQDDQSSKTSDIPIDIDSFIDSILHARTPNGEPVVSCEFEKLWESKELSELIELAEEHFTNDATYNKARIWWVRAHNNLAEMPTSILNGPLDIQLVNGKKSENKELRALLAVTLLEVARKNLSNNNVKDAVRFMFECYQIDKSCGEELQDIAQKELDGISLQDLPLSERESASARIDTLEEILATISSNFARNVSKEHETKVEDQSVDKQARKSQGIFPSSHVLLILFLLFGSWLVFDYFSSAQVGRKNLLPVVKFDANNSKIAMQVPVPLAKKPDSMSSLWHILDRLDAKDSASQKKNAEIDFVEGSINTKGPVEPAELALLIKAYDQRELRPDSALEANLDLSNQAQAGIRDAAIVPGYSHLPGIRVGSGRRAEGSNLQMYKITSSTRVFSHPSKDALSMAELEVGNQVEVVEILGKWLKIASSQERIGYIPDDTAIPLAPF